MLDKSKKPLYIAHPDKCKNVRHVYETGMPGNDEKLRTVPSILTIRCVRDVDCARRCVNLRR
mgnify:CR=1 FL=1